MDATDDLSRPLRRLAAGFTLAMTAWSWPLWTDGGGLPRVPFAPGLNLPEPAYWGVFLATLAALGLTATAERWRPWYALSAGLFLLQFLADQHRFQPWAYQYVMTGLFLAALPGAEGLRYARWWFIALYIYSGLSKLDVSFCRELGPIFLGAGLRPFGVDPAAWPERWRDAAVLAMPLGEIAVGLALFFPTFRGLGRFGALALHGLLIGILGPFGLGHSTLVLAWNAAVGSEVWVAFGPRIEPAPTAGRRWVAWPVKVLFWAGVLAPLAERSGWFDAWPGHALYASHVERISMLIPESELERYPDGVRRHARAVVDDEAGGGVRWRLVNLTDWSRELRGTPVYPQNRACLGLAEGLAARYGGRDGRPRVLVFGPADRWTGRRDRDEAVGLDAIRRMADRARLNARPAPWP